MWVATVCVCGSCKVKTSLVFPILGHYEFLVKGIFYEVRFGVGGEEIHTPLLNITFICIEDWKCSPEPQHNVHLKVVVDDDSDDKKNGHSTKHNSSGKYDVGICGDKYDTC